MRETELAYIAGLFDGEGCVNFTHSGQVRTLVLRAMVRNTNREIIDLLRDTFGGRIETASNAAKPKWKPSFCWRVDGAAAVEFLLLIEPWVRVKREQIFLAKVYDAVRNRDRASPGPEYYGMLTLLENQLKWLNRKGPRGADDREPIAESLATLPVPVDQILSEVGYAAH